MPDKDHAAVPNASRSRGKALAVKTAVVLLAPLWVPWVAVALPAALIHRAISGRRLAKEFLRAHEGKALLLVYSRSPSWRQYIETSWLPRLQEKAVIVDWSDRAKPRWSSSLEARIVRHFGGDREFNPMAICFSGGRVETIRFYRAFLDFKHGKPRALMEGEKRLFSLMDQYNPIGLDRRQS